MNRGNTFKEEGIAASDLTTGIVQGLVYGLMIGVVVAAVTLGVLFAFHAW